MQRLLQQGQIEQSAIIWPRLGKRRPGLIPASAGPRRERSIVMNIYVGNLSRDVIEEELRQAFEAFGQVTSVNIIKDKYSGQPRGFGFVEMATKAEGQAAIDGLKGKLLKERTLDVSEARPRPEGRRDSGPYGGRRTGGFGGGGRRRGY